MAVLIVLLTWLATCSAALTDEMQTFDPACLTEGAFNCVDGGCVPLEKYCDGKYDCKDGSDENFCTNHIPDALYCNDTHQFLCTDGRKCVPSVWVCNNETDCDDGSDEYNCSVPIEYDNSTCHGFLCDDNKKCISKFWTCDGYYDCDDKSDEDIKVACRHSLHMQLYASISDCEYRSHRHSCLDNSFCLPQEFMCNGMVDCRDGSDEGPFCENWHTKCDNFTCPKESFCKQQRTGVTCICDSYNVYNETTKKCEETDNCMAERPTCSHMCVDKGDYFKCICDPGYVPDYAGYLCFAPDPEAQLFFSTRNDIRYVKVKSKQQVTVLTGIKKAHGVSYDGNYLYWVETAQGHQAIMRAHLQNVEESKQVIAALGLEDPGDIAIDHLGDNIYFSDAERGVISVCRSDGSLCTTLRTNAKTPKFVTLDTRNGQMYWADWHDRAVLMVAQMDGSKPDILTDSLTTFATGLALDAPNQRLYFVDRTIKVIRLQDRLVYSFFEEPFHHPYSLAVFESTLYWSDWASHTLQAADKVHGAALHRNIVLALDEPVFDMHIYHPVLMNITHNPCENHKCQICLVTSNVTHVCACPDTMEIAGDHCEPIPGYRAQYLVVGAGSAFARVHYERVGNPETHAAGLDVGRVQAMAYDNTRDTLYIYDSQRRAINAINMSEFSLGVTSLLVHRGLENVVDMDYDFVSDCLYVLDAGRRVVEVVSLRSPRSRRSAVLHYFTDQEIPISFCVLPEYGRMLVALLETENNNEIHIDSIGLDGEDRKHQLMSNILGPNIRVRYSPELNVVYIADEGNGIIDIVHPEGTGRENFREVLTTMSSLAVTETHVFWTDRRTQRLYWADVHEVSRKIRRIELSIFPNDTNLHIVATSPPPDPKSPLTKHKCYQQITPCSHICVQSSRTANTTAASTDYKCLCPSGYHMFKGICSEVVKCKSNELYCHRSNDCFIESKRCDGHKDCWYGEDEEGCAAPVTQKPSSCPFDYTNCHGNCIPINQVCKENTTISLICGPNELRCSDGSVCVERALACDGHSDCPDGSDELPAACDARRCYDTEFMCSSGNCIPVTWKCDASADCADGSDEADCESNSDSCPEDNYQCSDGTCIKLYKRCDGKYDCVDRDDEDGCDINEFIETEPVPTCSPGEFACERNKSICLPYTARCNSKVDCPGATDEDGCDMHCEARHSSLFSCKQEFMCINKKHVCNGRKDCTDGSDETLEACAKVNKTAPLHSMFPMSDCSRGYRCDSGHCIEWSQVCDTRPDCIDHSDENGLCDSPCTDACPGGCARTPRGPHCACARGLAPRGAACADVDECAAAACAQLCRNLPGSFVCACYAGYALRPDRRSCKAIHGRPTILYARGDSVWSTTNHIHSQVYQDQKEIDDLDVDARRDKMYMVSSEAGKLVEVDLSSNASTPDVITNVGRPSKVAVDWVTGNVYFVDSSPAAGCVRVCNFRKKRCARLQRLPSEAEVTALAVDPSHRRLYYCISRHAESAARASTLFGRAAPEPGAAPCRGLALGPAHLYLASVEPDALLRVDYDGSAMSPVITHNANLINSHDLAFFEDHVYFLSNSHLKRCLIFGSKTCENYSFMPNTSAFVIKHEVTQVMIDNDCDGITCDNVCVMGDGGAVCVCHDGGLARDGVCPIVKSDDLAVFNGATYQERRAHAVSLGLVAAVLVLFALYIAVFIYYYIMKKKKQAGDYMQVRYHNTPDAMGQLTNPIIDMPEAGYVIDGMGHEFVNPLQYVKNIWQDSLYKRSKPGDTSGLIFETQDLSDTESDLDVKETRRIVRN